MKTKGFTFEILHEKQPWVVRARSKLVRARSLHNAKLLNINIL